MNRFDAMLRPMDIRMHQERNALVTGGNTGPTGSPVRGNRVVFAKRPGSNVLDTDTRYPLVRAEDSTVSSWTVTLGPVYAVLVGPDSNGGAVGVKTGAPIATMTWGGGGVTYRQSFYYPVTGTSFSVAGDNVSMEVRANDGVTAFTDAELVAVNAWITPWAAGATNREPLVIGGLDAPFSSGPVPAFARALVIGASDVAAAVSVAFTGPLGTGTIALGAGAWPKRIPIPAAATSYTVLASAGTVAVMFELAFT